MPATNDDSPTAEEHQLKSLDHCIVTEEIKLKAQEELNETDETRETCLRELKTLLRGQPNLNANTSDQFLLQFLRAKKFRIQAAFLMVKNYYGHRSSYPNLYKNYSPKLNQKVMNSNLCSFLPWRTLDDCAIWVARVGSWDPKDFTIEELVRFGIMCHDKALQNPVTQICGITTILDLQGFSWTHLWHIPSSLLKCFISIAQDCLPIRHKAIHVINNPSIFGLLFGVMKPFITRKIRGRIHFHGYDLSSLQQYLHPTVLPSEFGGTRGPLDNRMFYDSLLASEEEFTENQKFGYAVQS